MARIFISYAHEDEAEMLQMQKFLAPLLRDDRTEIWVDRHIQAGASWEEEIMRELNEADVVIMLISADFLASTFINEVEIPRAMERREKEGITVIPVILNHCQWTLTGLKALQALPKDGKPIADYDNTDKAYNEVVTGIGKLLNKSSKKRSSSGEREKFNFHDWHRYTCDRTPQDRRFKQVIRGTDQQKACFYYIYGLDLHSHFGLVKRFQYDLMGVLKSHLNPKLAKACTVERSEIIPVMLDEDLEYHKIDILTSLFADFDVQPNSHEPLLDKTIVDLWQSAPRLKGLGPDDQVCCYLGIHELDWDAGVTPQIVDWLISDFCGSNLPAEAPTFHFYLGIEFERPDSPVRDEVLEAIREKERIYVLDELQIVRRRDIQRWFNMYRNIFSDPTRRDELLNEHFGADADEFYMNEVEVKLKKIIDQLAKNT
jgi:hypothetical protein